MNVSECKVFKFGDLGVLQTKKSIADAICESCLEEGTFFWLDS